MADPNARKSLEAEAERLRVEREASAREAGDAERAARSAAEARARSFSAGRLRRSVSPHTSALLFSCIAGAALAWGVSADREQAHESTAVPIALAWAALGVGVAVLLHHFVLGAWRHRRWVASLPFRVAGLTEALGSERAATKVAFALEFSDTVAPRHVVEELVRARLPPPREDIPAALEAGSRFVISAEFFTEPTNAPLRRWFRQLAPVLLEVHRGWPLASVDVTVRQHADFHRPGGPD